jgi:hypothetical protein
MVHSLNVWMPVTTLIRFNMVLSSRVSMLLKFLLKVSTHESHALDFWPLNFGGRSRYLLLSKFIYLWRLIQKTQNTLTWDNVDWRQKVSFGREFGNSTRFRLNNDIKNLIILLFCLFWCHNIGWFEVNSFNWHLLILIIVSLWILFSCLSFE